MLILSASRGGSTIFSEVLRRHRGLRHLPGEVNPMLRRAGLCFPALPDDGLSAAHAATPAADRFCREVLARAGGWPAPERLDREAWAQDAREQLGWQWPQLPIRLEQVRAALDGVDPFSAPEHATLQILSRLRALHPALDPRMYDIGEPEIGLQPLPPQLPLTEEPPFLLLSPWERRSSGPLLLKTPANAFRLDFFRALVASGQLPGPLRLIHLQRNPASSINGLLDGWRYRAGFHACCLPPGTLEIGGYTEQVAGGDQWWKFDMPPGWQGLHRAPLIDVCAMQWASAHRAILGWRAAHPEVDCLPVRFEDFLRDMPGEVDRVLGWIGCPDPALSAGLRTPPPPRMSTGRPRHRRWFGRSGEILPALASPEIRALIADLGYDRPGSAAPDGWI